MLEERTPGADGTARSARPRPATLRRRPTDLTFDDWATAAASAASAVALTWIVFTRLADGASGIVLLLVAYLIFVGLFTLVTADRLGRLPALDRLATIVVTTLSVILLIPLVWLIGYIVVKGVGALSIDFLTNDMSGVTATDPASEGGAAHAIVGTIEQVALALVMTVPLSLACAIFLNETTSRLRRPVRIFVDAMSGLPSIVAGLFIYATLIIPGSKADIPLFEYNGFMASLALSIVMMPTITRTVEVVLRLVPSGLREAGLALGSTRARMVWSVVLPTARSGLTTAIVLGIARAVGETAPLLFTAFGYNLMNATPFEGPQDSLPLYVYKNIRQPSEASIERGFAGALVLMGIVLSLFVIARVVGRDRSARSGPRRVDRLRLAVTKGAARS